MSNATSFQIPMQKITPFLWFNDQAEEAANFYVSAFKNSKILNTTRYQGKEVEKVSGRPEGSVMTVEFELCGQRFSALNGGPVFTFTPAVSFTVECETAQEVDELWAKLSDGGKALMELGEYPFSKKYGWIQDKYGVSWQLILNEVPQKISPFIMFIGAQLGKAEEAMKFYCSVFPDSKIVNIFRAGPGELEKEGTISHAVFLLNGQQFMALESGLDHKFTITEATSFVINCDTQEEVDRYWDKLTEGGDPKAQQCGWLKDKYGVSWQVVPTEISKIFSGPNGEKATAAMLKMKKLDIQALRRAAGLE